jgi:hypothetical protein
MKRIFTISVFLVTAFTLQYTYGCKSSSGNKGGEGQPKIEFKNTEHDFGTIEQNGDGTTEFVFTNTGDAPLILSNVRSSCGCTVPKWPRDPVAPGDSASIDVKYDTRRIGSFSKTITVYSNATETPIILKIKGTVEAPAAAQ